MVDWAEFEEYLYPTIRKKYPARDGWKIEAQKVLKSGLRIDWVVFNGSQRIVIEAKDKQKLQFKDVEQVSNYRYEYKAQKGILYVANDTIVPDNVKEFCKMRNIKIIRTKWRQ
ncbi:MAG: restriction endonuclease [Candidatus Helarchaeota archaeon]|nr:restriction endonuclease [Candidatus Helarchaeota archaeon]